MWFACVRTRLKSVVEAVAPQFEKTTGHKLKAEYGPTGQLKTKIETSPAFDVTLLTDEAINDLIKSSKLSADSRAEIARSGIGVGIRKGGSKPDLGTAEAFKRALLKAQSIAYTEGGVTGTYIKGLLERFGIMEEVKPKLKFGNGGKMVSEGKAEIGLTQISEIISEPNAELAGPLPSEIQKYTVFFGAVSTGAAQAEAGKALLKFLKSPEGAKVLKAKGLEPLPLSP